MANQQETENAMVGALERHKRAESAHGGLFAIILIAAFAGMIALSLQLHLGGWYVVGGAVACVALAGVGSDWIMRRAKEREPERY